MRTATGLKISRRNHATTHFQATLSVLPMDAYGTLQGPMDTWAPIAMVHTMSITATVRSPPHHLKSVLKCLKLNVTSMKSVNGLKM